MHSSQVKPQQVLGGRYRLERELGRGGMGTVWQAEQLKLRSRVAVKILSSDIANEDIFARFLAEARAAAGLNSPHIVKLFDYGVEEGLAYLVMELLEGETLGARLRRERPLEPALVCRIFRQLARGITKAHQEAIVHRDLKPDNIFLVDGADDVHVKVLDFGIAKTLQAVGNTGPQTNTGATLGTLQYMSPEQLEDSKRVGIGTDIWSLGVIAYECLVGKNPFASANPGTVVLKIVNEFSPVPSEHAAVPDGFDTWFARCTARDPAERFGSALKASEQLSVLCGFVHDSNSPAPRPESRPMTRPTLLESPPPAPPIAFTDSPVSTDSRGSVVSAPTRSKVMLVSAVAAVGASLWWSFRDTGGEVALDRAQEAKPFAKPSSAAAARAAAPIAAPSQSPPPSRSLPSASPPVAAQPRATSESAPEPTPEPIIAVVVPPEVRAAETVAVSAPVAPDNPAPKGKRRRRKTSRSQASAKPSLPVAPKPSATLPEVPGALMPAAKALPDRLKKSNQKAPLFL